MNCIKKIRIRNFRSIVDINIDCLELNVFAGNNDAGKSNILKALDLFFNSEMKYSKRFIFSDHYSRFAPERINKAREIVITITFQPPSSFDSKPIVWTKKWRKSGPIPYTEEMKYEDRTVINTRSKFPLWLKRLRFEYIPAIKGTEYFSELLQKLHDSLIVTVEEDVRTA